MCPEKKKIPFTLSLGRYRDGKVSNLAPWLEHSAFSDDISIIQSPARISETLFPNGTQISVESINLSFSLLKKASGTEQDALKNTQEGNKNLKNP